MRVYDGVLPFTEQLEQIQRRPRVVQRVDRASQAGQLHPIDAAALGPPFVGAGPDNQVNFVSGLDQPGAGEQRVLGPAGAVEARDHVGDA